MIGIIQLLDPEGKGKVSFADFCQGVQQILEVQGKVELLDLLHIPSVFRFARSKISVPKALGI